MRNELAAGSEDLKISPDMLKKCKKYAVNKCDLMAAYSDKYHGEHGYKEFEHEFTMFLRQAEIGVIKHFVTGERVIEQGTRGNECFVIESGQCAICLADGTEILRKHQGEIFGEVGAFLVPVEPSL